MNSQNVHSSSRSRLAPVMWCFVGTCASADELFRASIAEDNYSRNRVVNNWNFARVLLRMTHAGSKVLRVVNRTLFSAPNGARISIGFHLVTRNINMKFQVARVNWKCKQRLSRWLYRQTMYFEPIPGSGWRDLCFAMKFPRSWELTQLTRELL